MQVHRKETTPSTEEVVTEDIHLPKPVETVQIAGFDSASVAPISQKKERDYYTEMIEIAQRIYEERERQYAFMERSRIYEERERRFEYRSYGVDVGMIMGSFIDYTITRYRTQEPRSDDMVDICVQCLNPECPISPRALIPREEYIRLCRARGVGYQ